VWEFGKRESVFGFGGGGGDLGECHIDSSVFQDSSRTTLTHLCKGNAELQTIIKLSITQEFHIIRVAELGFSKHASIGSFFFHFFFHVSGLALAFCRGLCHFGRGKRAPSVRSGRKPHMPTYKRLTHQSITRKTIIFKTLNLILFLTFFFSLIKKKNPNHRLFQTPPPPPLFHDIRRRQPPEKF
jgi:hypothetical protein